MPCPPPQIIRSACDSSSSWRPSPTTAHGGTSSSGPVSRDTTRREPAGSTSPGVRVSRASSASPRVPVVAVDGATTTTGPWPSGTGSTDDVGSKCSGPTTTASSGQSGRGTSSAGSVAMRRLSGPGSAAGKPISTRAAERWRTPSRNDRAVSARSTASRSRPRTPTPGASPLPSGGRPFDGRYSGCGFSSIHGRPINSAASPPHTVITSDTTRSGASSRRRGTFSTAILAARWWIFAPASVSSSVGGRVKPVELDGVHPRCTCGIQPFGAREQRRSVPGGEEPKAQRNGRKRVPGIRSSNHGDPHGPTLPQRLATRLAAMTDQASRVTSDVDNARTVETFLYALQDEDFDTARPLVSENIAGRTSESRPSADVPHHEDLSAAERVDSALR